MYILKFVRAYFQIVKPSYAIKISHGDLKGVVDSIVNILSLFLLVTLHLVPLITKHFKTF